MGVISILRPFMRQRQRERKLLIERSGLFDQKWYTERYPDTRLFSGGALNHYVLHGMSENRYPGPRFDPLAYLERYQLDFEVNSTNAMEHYLLVGQNAGNKITPVNTRTSNNEKRSHSARLEKVKKSGLFDAQWYLSVNTDLASSIVDPLEHFVSFGSQERRSPGPNFDAKWYAEEYLLSNPDSQPLFHYLDEGAERGYLTAAVSPTLDWQRRYFELSEEDIQLLDCGGGETVFFYLYDGDVDALAGFLASAIVHQGRAKTYVVAADGLDATGVAKDMILRDVEAVLNTVSALSSSAVLAFARGAIALAPRCSEILQAYAEDAHDFVMISDFLEPSLAGPKPYFVFQLSSRLGAALQHRVHFFATDKAALSAAVIKPNKIADFFSLAPYSASQIRSICINQFTYSDGTFTTAVPRTHVEHKWTPSISIIIPTKDGLNYLKACIESINNITVYDGIVEIIVVDNRSVKIETLTYLQQLRKKSGVKVLEYNDEFNFASINNMAAAVAQSEVLLFLNNDTSIIKEDWLSILVAELIDPMVGVVGAKLLYPDGLVQHGGVVVGIQGVAAHSHALLPSNMNGFQDLNLLTREVMAVTGACLAIRREVFCLVGGFDTNFKVAFNDVALCLSVIQAGFRNVFVASALLCHYESKSRGYDTTPEKKLRFFEETLMFQRLYWCEKRHDPYYSRSLSLEGCYELAEPPRGVRPWRLRGPDGMRPKVLMLSTTFQQGHGVAVVINQQVGRLLKTGCEVWLGGPSRDNEVTQRNVGRIYIDTPNLAARVAVRNRFDLVIVHTPPFYSIVRYIEDYPAILNYDYGEPPPHLFPDRIAREDIDREKLLCFAMARYKAAISQTVADDLPGEMLPILPLANSHLASWTDTSSSLRERVRRRLGWTDSFVVLTVCRFYAAERNYKGVDAFVDVGMRVKMMSGGKVEVVVCGRGTEADVEYLEARGVRVFPNVSDEELIDIYHAADAFVSMSKWEGYNLPIGQALALGLPVLASKIPAHEAFGVETFSYHTSFVSRLIEMLQNEPPPRAPKVWNWEDSLDIFESFTKEILATSRQRALIRL